MKVAVIWNVFIHSTNYPFFVIIQLEHFTHWVFFPKIFFGLGLVQHQMIWSRQSFLGVTLNKVYRKHFKESFICKNQVVFVENFIAILHHPVASIPKTKAFLYFRNLLFKCWSGWGWILGTCEITAIKTAFNNYSVNLFLIFEVFIETQFVVYISHD